MRYMDPLGPDCNPVGPSTSKGEAMAKTNGNRKGKRGERELAAELSRLFGQSCRRGVQYSGLGGADVVGLPGVHVECKRTEALRLYAAVEQAERDTEAQQSGRVPCVFHRANGKPWLVIVRLDRLPALVKSLGELALEVCDPEEAPADSLRCYLSPDDPRWNR